MRVLVPISLALALTVGASSARAQVGGNIDLNAFRPAMDSRGFITVNASQILGHGDVSFGLVTNWGYRVLQFEEGESAYEVTNVITPTLIAAVGLKLGPIEIEPGVSVPFQVMSGDEDPDFPGDPGQNNSDRFAFDGQGLGDVGLHMKWRLLSTSKGPRLGIALIGSVYLPTASEEERWLGEGKVTPQFMGVIDKELGEYNQLRLALTGGIRIRTGDHIFTDSATPPTPATGETVEAKSTVPLGAAISYGIVPQKFDIMAEAFTELPLGGENYMPGEAIAGIKLYLARNSFLSFGGGIGFVPDKAASPDARAFLAIVFEPNIGDRDNDGLKDDVDQCPDQPEDKDGFEDEDGCPEGNKNDRDNDGILDDVDQCPDDPEDKDKFEDEDGCPDPDNDQDGILDVDDLCPDQPEDKDGFEDADGCPDPDNDHDRILDKDDACPRRDGETSKQTAETYNGVDDTDGCPDRGRVVVTDTKIEILDKIYFEYDSDVIQKRSFGILDAILATLQGNPDIQLVEIQGHSDERGSDSYNLDLSGRRAASVRRYLVEHGVTAERLQSQGYGETQPIAQGHNEAAWSKNRRVEFLILKRANE